jgi:hypothetical protein
MRALREVLIIVSNIKTPDTYLMRSWPNDDYLGHGKISLFRSPVYKVFIVGTDRDGKPVRTEWTALRFSPFWNDPKHPAPRNIYVGQGRGWANSGIEYEAKKPVPAYLPNYHIHNSISRFEGAFQVRGNFLIHGGPETLLSPQWGAAGCVEVIGNFDQFRQDIIKLSGFSDVDVEDVNVAMVEIVRAQKVFVQYDLEKAPDLRGAFDREVPR